MFSAVATSRRQQPAALLGHRRRHARTGTPSSLATTASTLPWSRARQCKSSFRSTRSSTHSATSPPASRFVCLLRRRRACTTTPWHRATRATRSTACSASHRLPCCSRTTRPWASTTHAQICKLARFCVSQSVQPPRPHLARSRRQPRQRQWSRRRARSSIRLPRARLAMSLISSSASRSKSCSASIPPLIQPATMCSSASWSASVASPRPLPPRPPP
jgi:hypothetical protein